MELGAEVRKPIMCDGFSSNYSGSSEKLPRQRVSWVEGKVCFSSWRLSIKVEQSNMGVVAVVEKMKRNSNDYA